MRGRCAGSDPRFVRRLAARTARSAGASASSAASPLACDLLDLLEPEQQLIFGQRLGAPAEAMALQLLDDLFAAARLAPARPAASPSAMSGSSGSASAASRHGAK